MQKYGNNELMNKWIHYLKLLMSDVKISMNRLTNEFFIMLNLNVWLVELWMIYKI